MNIRLFTLIAALALVPGVHAALAVVPRLPLFLHIPVKVTTNVPLNADSTTLTAVVPAAVVIQGRTIVPRGSTLSTEIDASHAPGSACNRTATLTLPDGTPITVSGYFMRMGGGLGLPASPTPSLSVAKGERAIFVVLGQG